MKQTPSGVKTPVLLLAILCGGLGLQTASADDTMWIAEFSNTIDKVDVQTGATTLVGEPFPNDSLPAALSGIAFDPNEQMFGITDKALYKINKSDGRASLVGSFGPLIEGAEAGLFGLTFGQDGTLYARGLSTSEPAGFDLYTINTATGKATLLRDIEGSVTGDLAFANGKLYTTINTTKGEDTSIPALEQIDLADLSKSKIIPVSGIPDFSLIDELASPNAQGNTLFAVTRMGQIYSLNPSTGHASFVSQLQRSDGFLVGASFVTESVPEPSTFVCVWLAAGALAVWFAPKKRKLSLG